MTQSSSFSAELLPESELDHELIAALDESNVNGTLIQLWRLCLRRGLQIKAAQELADEWAPEGYQPQANNNGDRAMVAAGKSLRAALRNESADE